MLGVSLGTKVLQPQRRVGPQGLSSRSHADALLPSRGHEKLPELLRRFPQTECEPAYFSLSNAPVALSQRTARYPRRCSPWQSVQYFSSAVPARVGL